MKTSLTIGSAGGIPIEVNYTWIAIFGLITWTLAVSWFPAYNPGLPPASYWTAAVLSTLLLFISILLHELSHSFVARKNGIPIKKITLFIFGGVAQMEKEPSSPSVEFKVAVAGPLCSAFIAVFCFAAYQTASQLSMEPLVISVIGYTGIINASLAVFNMIPGFPLDGGRLLRATIWHFDSSLKEATHIASNFGKLFSFAFMLLGLVYLFFGQIISGVWFIIIGFFIHEAADLAYQHLVLKKALVGTKLRDIMVKEVICVPSDLVLERLVEDYFYKYRHLGFPVVDNGIFKGMVTMQGIKTVPNSEWGSCKVEKVLQEPKKELLSCPDEDALDALIQVSKSGLGKLLVIDKGRLVGIIAQRDLVKLFEIKENLCDFKS
ncbi:MAG: site-2 protease family protein [Candidatus Margulisiibacteriota bacterium]